MSLDYSATSALLKEMYPTGSIIELGLKNNPLFATIRKDPSIGGLDAKIPTCVAPVQNVSATFAYTQTMAAANSSTNSGFQLTMKKKYGTARITGQMIRASQGDQAAFVRALDYEIKQASRGYIRSLERQLSRDSVGWLGYGDGSSAVTGTGFTLYHPSMAHCFEVGMWLDAMSSNSGAFDQSKRTQTLGHAVYVTKVDRKNGIIYGSLHWDDTLASVANTDYLFPYGDYVTASDRLCLDGFESWCPHGGPGASDSFYGVNRSVDPYRLAGVVYDGTGGDTIIEALVNGQSEIAANGATPTRCYLSSYQTRRLINSLGAKVVYGQVNGQGLDGLARADIGFRTLMIQGDGGDIEVVTTPLIEYGKAWLVKPEEFVLMSSGDPSGILEEDGNMILRVYNADEYEVRIGGYLNLASLDTSSFGQVLLSV